MGIGKLPCILYRSLILGLSLSPAAQNDQTTADDSIELVPPRIRYIEYIIINQYESANVV